MLLLFSWLSRLLSRRPADVLLWIANTGAAHHAGTDDRSAAPVEQGSGTVYVRLRLHSHRLEGLSAATATTAAVFSRVGPWSDRLPAVTGVAAVMDAQLPRSHGDSRADHPERPPAFLGDVLQSCAGPGFEVLVLSQTA